MPLVRMLTSVAGPEHDWQAGDEVEMSGSEARVWADGVRGELVRGRKPETPEDTRHGRAFETPE